MKAAHKFFSEDKERAFEAKVRYTPCHTFCSCDKITDSTTEQMTDESARLLAFQQQLEGEADGRVKIFGLSVNETIKMCIMNGFSKRADKIKSDFKVPDKRSV